jgi:hypothetical protein
VTDEQQTDPRRAAASRHDVPAKHTNDLPHIHQERSVMSAPRHKFPLAAGSVDGRRDTLRRSLFGALVLAGALGLVFASASAAGPPTTATGAWLITGAPTVTDIRTAGNNTFITESFPFTYTGDVTGSAVASGTLRLESDGSAGFNGTTVCTGCSIGGRTGDFTTTDDAQESNDGQVKGVITVLSSTGGLTGLHAVDHFEGNVVTGTYDYIYSFEP